MAPPATAATRRRGTTHNKVRRILNRRLANFPCDETPYPRPVDVWPRQSPGTSGPRDGNRRSAGSQACHCARRFVTALLDSFGPELGAALRKYRDLFFSAQRHERPERIAGRGSARPGRRDFDGRLRSISMSSTSSAEGSSDLCGRHFGDNILGSRFDGVLGSRFNHGVFDKLNRRAPSLPVRETAAGPITMSTSA